MATRAPDERLIEEKTQQLLRRAETRGRFPTPVDDIVAAAGLVQPRESLLSGSILAEAPIHIRRAMQKLSGRVRAVLDRKTHEVHVDPAIRSQGRVAFHKLHEVTHEILPWQQALAYADDDATLSPAVHKLFEWEANIGASNLLFQNEYFDDLVRQYKIGIAAILEIAQTVGASGHATFRRFARVHDGAVAGVVMDLSPCSREPLAYRRHEVVVSDDWTREFGASWPAVLLAQPYAFVNSAAEARSSTGAVRTYWALPNLRNETVNLDVEVYCNQYDIFVLIWKPRRELLRRRTLLVA
jgi:hypothetical protein